MLGMLDMVMLPPLLPLLMLLPTKLSKFILSSHLELSIPKSNLSCLTFKCAKNIVGNVLC